MMLHLKVISTISWLLPHQMGFEGHFLLWLHPEHQIRSGKCFLCTITLCHHFFILPNKNQIRTNQDQIRTKLGPIQEGKCFLCRITWFRRYFFGQIRTRLGPNQDQIRTKLRPNQHQIRNKLGPNKEQIRTKLGPIRTKLGPIRTKLGPN